ncbi:MAG: KR domain-containing protein, partial [Candidatus Parabeggiatoa sp.]|nr:KR domain-containing protein [Candidatus Parabeggiatoa sp.]
PVRLEKTAEKISRLRERGVYLIIGGLGAIGLTLAEYLAKTVQARLILVGRSAFPPKKEWVHWLETHDKEDSVSSQIRKLQAFESWGAEVLLFSADVANQTQMQIVIHQAEKQLGPINGVINTAGVIDFAGVIHKRTRAMTESTLASKVKGTLVLDRLLQHVQLDFFVLGSSIGSIFYQAKFGQVGYAAASDFLDAFAYYKHCKEATSTVTIDWSDWQKIGMSVEAEKLWRKNHHKTEEASQLQNTLLPTEGVEVFKRILEQTFPRVVVSPQDLKVMIEEGDLTLGTFINPLEEVDPPHSTQHPRPKLSQVYTASQNEHEQRLADIWQQFLGVEEIGIHDDFFELGGDSLLATQLIAKTNKTLQTHLSSSSLLESPTIAQLVELIAEIESPSATQVLPDSLVRLQRGNPAKKPLFLVHPVGGTVFHFRELVRHLNDEQPVYGLQSQGLDGKTAPLTKIEDMATHYLDALRVVQAKGPYLIGGYSFGGSVAFEMAQQLQISGQQVASLIFIDVAGPDQMQQVPMKFEQGWETQVLAFMMEEGSHFTDWLDKLNACQTGAERLQYFLQHNKTLPANLELSDIQRFVSVITANFQAMLTYTPQVYSGDIVLFKAKERGPFNPPNPELSWSQIVTGNIKNHEVPGNHLTMNLSPNVEVMVKQLNVYLKKYDG